MALNIETFSNTRGGFPFFKAAGHPQAVPRGRKLLAKLAAAGPVAVCDPLGFAAAFAELYDFGAVDVAHVFVQDVEGIGAPVLGRSAQPVTELADANVAAVLVVAFDADRLAGQIAHLVPKGAEVLSLDAMRVGVALLGNRRTYLDPLNFATNFAFFRDADGHHTRIATANYWHGYGARDVQVWCCLMGEDGATLAEWQQGLPNAAAALVIDSAEVRTRFGLGDFTGQLFLHVIGVRGHDVLKYALDTYGDDPTVLSCTHDANAWPSDLFAGLPAPRDDERVVLWVQNSHPVEIPAGGIGLNLMGSEAVAWLDEPVAPFGTRALDVAELLPDARWPSQVEVQAGKHFVRPRYEVVQADGHSRIAHVNVERTDLKADPRLPELGNLLGKGFILPAPVLPPDRFRTIALPTPMSTAQDTLPVTALIYDGAGAEVARHRFGCLKRRDSVELDVSALAEGALNGHGGHVELVYDFADGGSADGWLHAIFRYEDRESGHAAETSFGAHMFNAVLTYKGEPQSYAGRAPGLSTRLFLSLAGGLPGAKANGTGEAPTDAMCCLIYPASTPWHETSKTELQFHDAAGTHLKSETLEIPCGGSHLFQARDVFGGDLVEAAGTGAYILIRDMTCRLFGYHGVMGQGGRAFSFDHMFGF